MTDTRRAVILQSSYIPWKGYFDLLHKADIFIVYDSVQFTKRDWRSRNKVRTEDGTAWLSIPVLTKGRREQAIDEAQVSDTSWSNKHWGTIERSLGAAPFFQQYAPDWRDWFAATGELSSLHEINLLFIRNLADCLGITTPIVRDRELGLSTGSPTERLINLCLAAEADSYLTGPAALDYLECELFDSAGLDLEVIDYSPYSPYEQTKPGFEAGVTVLDLLANVGPSARDHLVGRIDTVA